MDPSISLMIIMLSVSVLLMVLLSDMVRSSSWLSSRCVGSLLRLGLGTAVWYVTARIVFPHLEHVTGGRSLCV